MSTSSETEYDIIFAGGGTTACLVAGRLTIADPSLKILILEAGEHTRDQLAHIQPIRYLSHLAPTSTTVTFNVAKPTEDLGGRSLVVPSGRCVGGGSSVNFQMYTRGSKSDYDDWEIVHGNTGWGYKDLLPLLKKTETYQVKSGEATHGYSGPLKVSYGGIFTNIGKQFLEVAAKYDKGRTSTTDPNDLHSCNTYGRWQKWIDAETGRRSDVPHHFIYNQAQNNNLQILTGKRVKRVLFENNRAVGVEYVNDLVIRPESDQLLYTASASRLVIVSGGAFGSPGILERSGIGAKNILEVNGVKQIVDLPGVGENYQDHNVVFPPYLADRTAETFDALLRGEKNEEQESLVQWTEEGRGFIAHNGLDAGIKLRPTAEELEELGPEFKLTWENYFQKAPDKPVIWIGQISGYLGDQSLVEPRKYFTVGYYLEYPLARGSIHIDSGDDAHKAPEFHSGILHKTADLAVMRWGYKKSREYARRLDVYRGELLPGHPNFPEGSEAVCKGAATGPSEVSGPDISYTEEDNEVIDVYNRNTVGTAWHSMGTCAMKAREQGGVIDSRLNVYGVQGLKVADLSICPANVGANTYSTALVIGEKATILIAEELGIQGV